MDNTLAIVIPYFKNDFFEETLLSLQQQTDKRFMVYIGDDASEQSIDNLVDKFKNDIPIKYHRFADNLGSKSLTKQWDRCLKLINNETWACILGDDDCLSENFVECFYRELSNLKLQKSKLLRFATLKINEKGAALGSIQHNPKTQMAAEAFTEKYYGSKHSSLSEYVFSIASYNKYGFRDYPLAWCSDDMAWLEFSNGRNIVSCNEAYLRFRLSSKSISGTLNNNKKDAKRLFFRDLVLEKQNTFSRTIAIKNLKKYEVFLVITKELKKHHFMFFLKRFYKLRSLKECFKFTLRFSYNMLK
ncbi:glycosyltransferase family A protein [Pontimicrobium sp. SW4]|uniref:Glycosyltransferase family A protein n=1 Tax=Pontimicrobium sp. SW4 TaxID=3153519 RepID=A0AAU7BUX5_9FLAO